MVVFSFFDSFSLGLAYAGSMRNDVIEVLTPVMWDANSSLEVSGVWFTVLWVERVWFNCELVNSSTRWSVLEPSPVP